MQTIFAGIDLYEDYDNKSLTSCEQLSYKERLKNVTTNMLKTKFKNNLNSSQIETILKIYFEFVEKPKQRIFRGNTRYFVMAGVTMIVCKDIDIVCNLFSEIENNICNKRAIMMYSTLIKSSFCTYDDYDHASIELAYRSA